MNAKTEAVRHTLNVVILLHYYCICPAALPINPSRGSEGNIDGKKVTFYSNGHSVAGG